MTVCISTSSLKALNEFVPHKADEVMDLVVFSNLAIKQAHWPALHGIMRNAVRDTVRQTAETIVADLEQRLLRAGIDPETVQQVVGAYEPLTKIEG